MTWPDRILTAFFSLGTVAAVVGCVAVFRSDANLEGRVLAIGVVAVLASITYLQWRIGRERRTR